MKAPIRSHTALIEECATQVLSHIQSVWLESRGKFINLFPKTRPVKQSKNWNKAINIAAWLMANNIEPKLYIRTVLRHCPFDRQPMVWMQSDYAKRLFREESMRFANNTVDTIQPTKESSEMYSVMSMSADALYSIRARNPAMGYRDMIVQYGHLCHPYYLATDPWVVQIGLPSLPYDEPLKRRVEGVWEVARENKIFWAALTRVRNEVSEKYGE